MASFFRDAAARVASYIPGRSSPDYNPISTEDGDVEPTHQPVVEEEAGEEAPSTARQRAAKIMLSIALICLTFLLILTTVVV